MSRDVTVTIYPLYSNVDIALEKSIFKPEEEVIIPCNVKVSTLLWSSIVAVIVIIVPFTSDLNPNLYSLIVDVVI